MKITEIIEITVKIIVMLMIIINDNISKKKNKH